MLPGVPGREFARGVAGRFISKSPRSPESRHGSEFPLSSWPSGRFR